ncbi:MAG: hypothetical protein ACX939_14370 [Hyphococcus sp.]
MKAKTIRHIIIGLLLFTGVFHLAVVMLGTAPGLSLPLAGFGLLYTVISFYVRRDTNDGSKSHSRNAVIAAVLACTTGLVLGGGHYLSNGGPIALPIMFAVDIAIIAAGAAWLMKVRAKA